MQRTSERLKIEIKESAANDARTSITTLAALLSVFRLSDLLKQRTVNGPLDVDLKRTVKGATKGYLSATEKLLSRLATEPQREQKAFPYGEME